ncbi:UNVERIFIED_CONTAM: hypothetical protein NCL1_34366 [Trichonephila clavipes]
MVSIAKKGHTILYTLQKSRMGVARDLNGKDDLKEHYNKHTKGESYVCKTCGKEYKRQKTLKCHECVPIKE